MKGRRNSFASFVVALTCCIPCVLGFGCIDEDGTNVDWWIAYKLPRIRTSKNAFVSNGLGYAYFTSKDASDETQAPPVHFSPPVRSSGGSFWVTRDFVTPPPPSSWKLSSHSIADSDSIAGRTLKPFYEKVSPTNSFKLMYNDEFPNKTISVTMGHTKGVVGVEEKTRQGFWLIHSVPHYPPDPSFASGYDYPATGHVYGQTFFCISFGDESANTVGRQLAINEPFIFHSLIPDWVRRDYPMLFEAAQVKPHPHRDAKSPTSEELPIQTSGGTTMSSFAKSRFYGQDLYSSLVAPVLKVGLFSETWRHGQGLLHSNCSTPFSIVNVARVAFSAIDVDFSSEKDHSKWALSEVEQEPWVCIGDINRATTQFLRGGGTLCVKNQLAWGWFKGIIKDSENCPVPLSELPPIDIR